MAALAIVSSAKSAEVEFRSFEEGRQWIDDGENIGGSGFFQKLFGDEREDIRCWADGAQKMKALRGS